jgi:Uma2 family endonuclease
MCSGVIAIAMLEWQNCITGVETQEHEAMVATHTVTAQELWTLGGKIEPSELIEGELKAMVPPGGEHGFVQVRLGGMLDSYAEQSGFGRAFGETGYVLKRNPDTVLAPDLSVVAADRLPADMTRFLELAPDVAVEIVSPGNAPGEIERKLAIYLEAGVQSVWIVYPAERQLVIHRPTTAPRIVTDDQPLEDAEVLPGFSVTLSRVFGTSGPGGIG